MKDPHTGKVPLGGRKFVFKKNDTANGKPNSQTQGHRNAKGPKTGKRQGKEEKGKGDRDKVGECLKGDLSTLTL